jgi:hypothetical protein
LKARITRDNLCSESINCLRLKIAGNIRHQKQSRLERFQPSSLAHPQIAQEKIVARNSTYRLQLVAPPRGCTEPQNGWQEKTDIFAEIVFGDRN